MKKVRTKMPSSERAKQFMPFAALSGLQAALEEKEKELMFVEKAELTAERIEELERVLGSLQHGMQICVEYYRNGSYWKENETVNGINVPLRMLLLEENRIPFEDIKEIEVISEAADGI